VKEGSVYFLRGRISVSQFSEDFRPFIKIYNSNIRNVNITFWNKQGLWFLRYVSKYEELSNGTFFIEKNCKTYRTVSAIFEFLEKFPLICT